MRKLFTVLALCLLLIEIGFTAASAQSCNSKESCHDKLITLAECTVSISSENMLVRKLPSASAQAVGILSKGDKVYVNDRQGLWVFVQGYETDDKGRQATTGNAGWVFSFFCQQLPECFSLLGDPGAREVIRRAEQRSSDSRFKVRKR
jgi:uncharacterized protein YgiM (DUF1202 family)